MIEESILKHLPEDNHKYFLAILTAYLELKNGDNLGFFKYETFGDCLPILSNEKNYSRKLEIFITNFEVYKPFLPKEIELQNLPRNPRDIKLSIEEKLIGVTSEKNILRVIEALFGTGGEKRVRAKATVRLTKKNDREKMILLFSKQFTHKYSKSE